MRPASAVPLAASSPAVDGALLAFVAGYVDVVGFIALFGLFTAHVTGNFVMVGVGLVESSHGLLGKLLALPVFIVSVAATTMAIARFRSRAKSPVATLLITQALLLSLFMAAGLLAMPIVSADAPLALLAGMLGVAAMGVQNTQSRIVLTDQVPTTIMTGNTTQVIIDAVHLLQGTEDRDAALKRLRKMVPAVVAFAVGAVLGAYAVAGLTFWCLLLPIATLILLAFRSR
jgi:uncharacterized membrane protein YoaK (UPF0700 family)